MMLIAAHILLEVTISLPLELQERYLPDERFWNATGRAGGQTARKNRSSVFMLSVYERVCEACALLM
jgi:hypothetical protein